MRKFKIDDYLGNHSGAIKHLCAASDDQFDEVLSYTQRHALYEEALIGLASQPERVMVSSLMAFNGVNLTIAFSFCETFKVIG